MLRALFFLMIFPIFGDPVMLGIDRFFQEGYKEKYKEKRIALLTNQTGVNSQMRSSVELFQEEKLFDIRALFSPEHGLQGVQRAAEAVAHGQLKGIPVYSLHGETRRPKPEMLKEIDVLIYDIQCTGVRAYTYETTLFYVMEEAAKLGVEVVVLDRPNPINGLVVDGPMLEEKFRSFIGYINVPYCHGMTIGELASFFNAEYKVGCKLTVIPMTGWKRSMSYRDTGLQWIPPSPNVPEPDTPLFCPMTGLLGELQFLNIGIGFTLPFKIVGAPWITAADFAQGLNQQKLPGVHFHPFHFRPFSGRYKNQDCQGALIQILDHSIYRPLSVQYLILGMLKSLYPKEVMKCLENGAHRDLFCKANGTDAIYAILLKEKYPAWKLIEFHREERGLFLEKRKGYLLY